MGAHPYWYFVDYQADIEQALQELREREFRAGRYNPAMRFPTFPVGPNSPSPGPRHKSVQHVIDTSTEEGTRSILDIQFVADVPDFCAAVPVGRRKLESLFGTDKPTRELIENNMDVFEGIERGHCIYIVAFKDSLPSDIFFAGYSFD